MSELSHKGKIRFQLNAHTAVYPRSTIEDIYVTAILHLKRRYPSEWPSPVELPRCPLVEQDIRLRKEDAIELAEMVVVHVDNTIVKTEEIHQKAFLLLRKFFPYYCEKETNREKGENKMDKYIRQKVENILQGIPTTDPEQAFVLALKRLKVQYPHEWPTPKEMPSIPSVKIVDIRLKKEQAIELGKMVVTFNDNPKPSEEEAYRKALPLLKKFYPTYFEKETAEKIQISATILKEITISESCSLCGLCDQDELSDIFTYDGNGKLIVRHGGMVDVRRYPKVLEIAEMCPEKAIQIGDVQVLSQEDIGSILDQFNRLLNKDLRDYPFKVPDYQDDYAYQTKTYQALPVPARYRSEAKYRTYEGADDAGLSEFVRAVYKQAKTIKRQYVAAYRVKQLERYYTYEDTPDNFYYRINREISQLLEKAVQLASVISKNQIKFPDNFEVFDVKPDWKKTEYAYQVLKKFEDVDFDIESSTYFELPDGYRCCIHVDGDDKYYYDFAEAEKTFREDIDSAIDDCIEPYVSQWVEALTKEYLDRAKAELFGRINFLQTEAKKFMKSNGEDVFKASVKKVCDKILQTPLPEVSAPEPDFDTNYDGSYCYRSESSCESAAERRREKAYNAGHSFLEKLPRLFNEPYMEAISKVMTVWKRELLSAYDISGMSYPSQGLKVAIGKDTIQISLSDHSDVPVSYDTSIRDYMERNLASSACYGSVNGVSYMSEYDCEIRTFEDFDVRETIFGNIKEVNHRYSYHAAIYEFKFSAANVSRACGDVLKKSDFMREYFTAIKQSFISEIHRIIKI